MKHPLLLVLMVWSSLLLPAQVVVPAATLSTSGDNLLQTKNHKTTTVPNAMPAGQQRAFAMAVPEAVSSSILTINGPSSICAAANAQYSSNVAGGVWGSSDPGVATIDNSTGLANAVAAGTTTISYTAVVSGSPSTATLLVTVNARPNATIAITENNVVFNQFTNAAYYNASYTDGILCTGPLSAGPTTSATLTAGGSGNYLWSNNATTAAITTSTAGTYTVVVTNAAGCQSTGSQTIAVNAAPNAGTISVTPPTPLNSNGAFRVCFNATITLNSTVPGGIWEAVNKFPSPQVVSIDPLTGLVMPLVSTINVDTHMVIYRVTANGCKSSTFVTAEVLEPPNAGTISGTTSVCAGSTTQLSSNGTTAVNTIRTWSSDNAGVATVNPSTGLVTGVAQGTATITYTVTNFIGSTSSPILLCTSTTTTLVTVTAAPNAGTISGTTTVCAGATTQLSSNGTGGGNWSSSNTGAATVNASGLVSGVAGGTSTITYIVTANGCASSSTSVLVTVNNVPNAGVISGTMSVCAGFTTQLSSNGIGGGTWSSSNPAAATVNASGLVSGLTSGMSTITYTVTANGCSSSATTVVTVNAIPNAGVISGATSVCAGFATQLSSNGIGGGAWSSSNPAAATVNAAGLVSGQASGMSTITYTVTANGCNSSASAVVTVNAIPSAGTISASPSVVTSSGYGVCYGSTITLSSSVPGGVWDAYNKFPSAQVVSANPTTGLITPLVSTMSVDSHSVFYRVTVNGCTGSVRTGVVVLDQPNAGVISGVTSVCTGFTTQLSSNGVGGGTWSSSNPTAASVNASGLVSGLANGMTTITYMVTSNGCSSSATAVVTVNAIPNAGGISGTTSVCAGETTQLSSNGAGGGTWSSNNPAAATVNTSGLVSGLASGMSTITYMVTSNGCSSSATAVVTVNAVPSAGVISGTTSVCSGFTTQLSSNGAVGGTWSSSNPAAATVNASGLVSGQASGMSTITYMVTSNGCSSSASAVVTVNAIPNAGGISGTTSVCAGETTQLSSNGAGGGTWSSNNPAAATVNTSGLVSGQASGMSTITYMVTSNGCSSSATAIVTVNTCNATFDGRILWSRNNTVGVKDVTVAVSGSASGSTITPTSGLYAITVSPGSNFAITPSKNINLLNGVNAQDVWRINQHVAANPILLTNPMDWIAADVNGNNTITPLDANIIQMSLLNNPQAIAQWTSSWRFVPASYALSLPPWGFPESAALNGSASNVNFYGIKVGDVVSAFANPANGMGSPFVLRTPDQLLETGRIIQADFSADALADIAALQFALHFDPAQLQLEQVTALNGLPLASENFGASEAGSGTLRLLWATADKAANLKHAAPVFRLQFKALESGSRLSEVLGLDPEIMAGRVYNSREAEAGVELHFDAVTATGHLQGDAGYQLLQNRPNPFTGATRIGFVLPHACEAQWRIFDAAGRVVAERTQQYPAGRQEEHFELSGVSGLFYYELTTPFGVLTKKMTKVE